MTDGREDIRQDSLAEDIVEREAWLRSFGMTPYTSPGDYDMSKIKKMRAEFLKEKRINGTLCGRYDDLTYTDVSSRQSPIL